MLWCAVAACMHVLLAVHIYQTDHEVHPRLCSHVCVLQGIRGVERYAGAERGCVDGCQQQCCSSRLQVVASHLSCSCSSLLEELEALAWSCISWLY
jgi:hypothetical protein